MGFLIPALATIAGSVIAGNAQKAAAKNAANAQNDQTNAQYQQLQNNEQQYRDQVNAIAPYLGGPSQAASDVRSNLPYQAPNPMTSSGGIFGGQHVQSTPGAMPMQNTFTPPAGMPQFPADMPAHAVTPQMQSGFLGRALGTPQYPQVTPQLQAPQPAPLPSMPPPSPDGSHPRFLLGNQRSPFLDAPFRGF